jgi:hypothetical protein
MMPAPGHQFSRYNSRGDGVDVVDGAETLAAVGSVQLDYLVIISIGK